MLSTVETEIRVLYMNARQLLPLRVKCEELGYPQPAISMQIDNNTASDIVNAIFNQS